MEPAAGKSFGHFTFVEKLGEGGMGVVWKARDTRLDRDVAVKILPGSLADDPERMERFNREARVLAALNHPNIAGIHGLEEHDGARFLVMEIVPGQDLMHRLKAGPISIEDALEAARQIADGLEAAHESGIIHRDLKPANIQITPEGQVKILDFGLAKAFEPELDSPAGSLSPTLTTPATRAGVILGTAAYMSPEQAKGRKVDKRADIWAFGCVLFEMLTGLRPFKGEGISETLASVIMGAPDLETLPAGTPSAVCRLLERCLEKEAKRRLRDIGEARYVLEEVLAGRGSAEPQGTVAGGAPAAAKRSSMAGILIVAVIGAAAGAAAMWLARSPATERLLRRFEIPVAGVVRSPVNGMTLAISPDGRMLAWVHERKLWLRRLDKLEAREIPVSAPPHYIFWSPDSQWLAWNGANKLWKVQASGAGEPVVIADDPIVPSGGCGGTWRPDGMIFITRGSGPIFQVPARGGDITTLLEPDHEKEGDFHQPSVMPDGSGILFATHVAKGRPDTLELLENDGKRKVLHRIEGQDIWDAVYSPTGHILYRRQPVNAGIWALPFDLASHTVTGDPFMVVPKGNMPSVSSDGTLVHVLGGEAQSVRIIEQDREGRELREIGEEGERWPFLGLSPDGNLLAVPERENDEREMWLHDLTRGTRSRLTFDQADPGEPFWSPDGQTIYYHDSSNTPPFEMFRKRIDGSGEAEKLGSGWRPVLPPDGGKLLFTELNGEENYDIWMQDLEGGGKPEVFISGPDVQANPRVSPDGAFVAYNSLESGGLWGDIFLKKFPSGEGKWQVSISGGTWPRWSRSGDRIYYSQDRVIWEVDFTGSPQVRLGKPRIAFPRIDAGFPVANGWDPGFDVSADGKRAFRFAATRESEVQTNIIIVESWFAEFGGGKWAPE